MTSNRLHAWTRGVSQANGLTHVSGQKLAFPRDRTSEHFFINGGVHTLTNRQTNRCWLAVAIHSLSFDPLLFQISQEMALLDMPADVAEARRLKLGVDHHLFSSAQLQAGLAIARLVQDAWCKSLTAANAAGSNALFFWLLDLMLDTIVIQPKGGNKDGVQDMATQLVRDLMCAACAVVDPTSAALRQLTRNDGFQFVNLSASQLYGQLVPLEMVMDVTAMDNTVVGLGDLARTIEVISPSPTQLHYNPKKIMLGSYVYRATHAIRVFDNHMTVLTFNAVTGAVENTIDSHGGSIVPQPKRVGTNYLQETHGCHLFLARVD